MTNYTELKRLAEECKERDIDFDDVSPQQGSTSCDKLVRYYIAAVSPDVVLRLLAERDDLRSQVDSLNVGFNNCQVERDTLRTQKQALVKEMRHIAGISNGQVKRVADQALAAQAEGGV